MGSDIRILTLDDACPELPVVEGAGRAVALVWPGTGAALRSMHHVALAPGAGTVALRHPDEAVYYVQGGTGSVFGPEDGTRSLIEGSMIHIGPGTSYRFAAGEYGMALLGGPCPPDPALYAHLPGGSQQEAQHDAKRSLGIRIFHRDEPDLKLPFISKDARFVVWLGVGAETANMNYVRMEPGEANVPHIHEYSEDTIFILEGEGTVRDFDRDRALEFRAGQAIHVPPGVKHAVAADRGVEVVSVGGPAPADKPLLRRAGVLKEPAESP